MAYKRIMSEQPILGYEEALSQARTVVENDYPLVAPADVVVFIRGYSTAQTSDDLSMVDCGYIIYIGASIEELAEDIVQLSNG